MTMTIAMTIAMGFAVETAKKVVGVVVEEVVGAAEDADAGVNRPNNATSLLSTPTMMRRI